MDLGSGGAYTLVLAFDGDASTFLITDPQSSFTLEVPIAGSGIFGGNSCVGKMTGNGSGTKPRNVTWRTIDDGTYRTFIANASRYRVQTTTGGGLTVSVPLTDGNCRGTP